MCIPYFSNRAGGIRLGSSTSSHMAISAVVKAARERHGPSGIKTCFYQFLMVTHCFSNLLLGISSCYELLGAFVTAKRGCHTCQNLYQQSRLQNLCQFNGQSSNPQSKSLEICGQLSKKSCRYFCDTQLCLRVGKRPCVLCCSYQSLLPHLHCIIITYIYIQDSRLTVIVILVILLQFADEYTVLLDTLGYW